jgi:hypothetical protein
MPAMSAWV